MLRYVWLFAALLFTFSHAVAQDTVTYTGATGNVIIGDKIAILEDAAHRLTASQAMVEHGYINKKQQVPNLQITGSAYWVKMIITNATSHNDLALQLDYPTIDSVGFYRILEHGGYDSILTGEFTPFYTRAFHHQTYIFHLGIPAGQTRLFFMKVMASEQMQLPMNLGTSQTISDALYTNDLIFGVYAGLILVMVLYNFFIYLSVKDTTYLYYVLYILFVGLVQACLQGYAPRFIYPDSYFLANATQVWVPAISGICGIGFTLCFLSAKDYVPGLYKLLRAIQVLYCVIIAISFTGSYRLCAQLLLVTVGSLAILVYITAIAIAARGYRPAKFFVVAWTVFIGSVVVFVLRNFNVLPFNTYTYYALQIGSACEVVLLSLALADKISSLRKEKEATQVQMVEALKENERIVRDQNVMLEAKVEERTHELNVVNVDLNTAMTELKDAQMQLVEAEKMASLGQLTAGIAHEINNPINFVTSNVGPLGRDVNMLLDAIDVIEQVMAENTSAEEKQQQIAAYKEDIEFDYLKTEIGMLLKGIGDGADRTAEIVKGLRIFSRLDEDDLKKADVNEGIESTLIIANNLVGNHVKIIKQLGNLPLLECFPGKLNQVFLNLISNAVYAIGKKFGDKAGGLLTITTYADEASMYIKIADNGTGMDEKVRKKIFEPFFTTKEVGEGTGLGLSIVYNTIAKHHGHIQVNSEQGIGTEFILILPLIQKPHIP